VRVVVRSIMRPSRESVVVSANFLIDAESSLKSALERFGEPEPRSGDHADRGGM
jgi:hypothetical protein